LSLPGSGPLAASQGLEVGSAVPGDLPPCSPGEVPVSEGVPPFMGHHQYVVLASQVNGSATGKRAGGDSLAGWQNAP
jgi:hypothetical protein